MPTIEQVRNKTIKVFSRRIILPFPIQFSCRGCLHNILQQTILQAFKACKSIWRKMPTFPYINYSDKVINLILIVSHRLSWRASETSIMNNNVCNVGSHRGVFSAQTRS
jgi:hypothetical protein